MKYIFNVMEKGLLVVAILCIIFLLVVQFLSYENSYIISTSRFGWQNRFSPFSDSQSNGKGIIILKNMTPEYKDVNILVNGDYFADFTNNDEVQIHVYDNDVVEVDGTKYNQKLQLKITGISSNIDSPKLDTIVDVSQSIEMVGKVQLK